MHNWIVTPYEPSDLPKLSLYFKNTLSREANTGPQIFFNGEPWTTM